MTGQIKSRKSPDYYTIRSIMQCPDCHSKESCVIDSRSTFEHEETTVRRRRQCLSCDHRYTTYEVSSKAFSSRAKLRTLLRQVAYVSSTMAEELDDK